MTLKAEYFQQKIITKTPEHKPAPKSAPTEPTKHMTFKLKLPIKFKDEIVTAKKDIIGQIFWKNFNHQGLSRLLEDFLEVKHAKMRN